MAVAPGQLCSAGGCGVVVRGGTRCPRHPFPTKQRREWTERDRAKDRERGSAAQRGYDWPWKKARDRYLMEHPLCAHCLAKGRRWPADEVDHIVPLRQGGDKYDEANLQSLCRRCHARKTLEDTRRGA